MASPTIIYASLGRMLHVFAAGPAGLQCLQSTELPRKVQYGWPTRDRRRLYLASSGPDGAEGSAHHLHVFTVAPDGRLTPHGADVILDNRPLYLTLDAEERYLLVAYNDPPAVTVHRLLPDGCIGSEVSRLGAELGPTVHQVRVSPAGNVALVPACAHHQTGALAGRLDLFRYDGGRLTPLQTLGPPPERAVAWRGVKNGCQ